MNRNHFCICVVFIFTVFASFIFTQSSFAQDYPIHPLDPLNENEISSAVTIAKTSVSFPKEALFSTVVLNEPPKNEVINFRGEKSFRREALAVVYDRAKNKMFESLIDLRANKILSWKEILNVQPLVFVEEYDRVPAIVKADPQWQAAMRKRGITDFDKIQIDTWAAGQVDDKYSGRLLRALSYFKDGQVNFYGRPIEGVVVLVNMNTQKVVEVTDIGIVPLPPPSQEFGQGSVGKLREKTAALQINQPNGAGFTISGNEVRWQKWRFRYTMHPREGLVLHTVGYEDKGTVRPVLYRAALSEMVVPYGDPTVNWRWRSAFDVGEYSVGRLASPLEPNADAPENSKLINAVFADDNGKPYTLERAVAIYERDAGILWKHFDSYSGKNETRRARELVLFFVATIGNYDYAVNYIFKQDGSMEVDLALSGIMLPKGVKEKRANESKGMEMDEVAGHLVSPNVLAPNHQHFFNFRLDFDVDGTNNSVVEMNSSAISKGYKNPYFNGFVMKEKRLETETEGARSMDMASARTWSVINPSEKNSLGNNTGYILVPGSNSLPYISKDAMVRKRAGFINNHFWATKYNPVELNAAGVYPNQSKGGDGLPAFISNNESIVNTDVVVWYTLGVTHIPRPEEWPVMPVTHVGFKIIPGNFFNANPGLDVPK